MKYIGGILFVLTFLLTGQIIHAQEVQTDLQVLELGFVSENNLVGEEGRLFVEIINNGEAYAPFESTQESGILSWSQNFLSAFTFADTGGIESYDTSRAIPSVSNPLATGESISFLWTGSFEESGTFPLTFSINTGNFEDQFPENDSLTQDITIFETVQEGGPDLEITDISFTAPSMTINTVGTLSVTVTNHGDSITTSTPFENFNQNFVTESFLFENLVTGIDSFSLSRDFPSTENPLGMNEDITYSWRGSFQEPGIHSMIFAIDVEDTLQESNEENNNTFENITITETLQSSTPAQESNIQQTSEEIMETVSQLRSNFDEILQNLGEVRNNDREQVTRNAVLNPLMQGIPAPSENSQLALNNFLTYGVDSNTQQLGQGERAAVLHSFKDAFGRLPESDQDFEDMVKIANGNFPSQRSSEAESRAKELFRQVYLRIADMNDAHDSAAIHVIAYGLRQRAENRNLESESQGINTFFAVFSRTPQSTEDWNVMQAITYSGATRLPDTDRDFLPDARESSFGTQVNNPDSDGDGYLDGIEVENGYNPLGEGRI